MAKTLSFSPKLHNQIFHQCVFNHNLHPIHRKNLASVNSTVENFFHFERFTSFSSSSLLPLGGSRSSYPQRFLMSSNSQIDAVTNQPQDSSKTIKCVIKGRVQGVFYRNWTVENATQLGLKGWVRNRRDGAVEALISGKPETVDEMLQRCRRGPPDAMVTALEATTSNEDPGTGFQRKSTL